MQSLPPGKTCPKCHQWKSRDDFYATKGHADGMSSYCRICHREHNRAYRAEHQETLRVKQAAYAAEHREEARQRAARWYAENRDRARAYWEANRERRRAYMLRWRDERAEYIREYRRTYHQQHRDALRAKSRSYGPGYYLRNVDRYRQWARNWRRANPAIRRAYKHRRRALKLGNGGRFTVAQFAALCVAAGQRCLCCGRVVPLEADHVVPLSKGGSNDISNIQVLCRSCNSRKGTQVIDYRIPHQQERQMPLPLDEVA